MKKSVTFSVSGDLSSEEKALRCLRLRFEINRDHSELISGLLWELETLGFEEKSSGPYFRLTAYFSDQSPENLKTDLIQLTTQYQIELRDLEIEPIQHDENAWIVTHREFFKPFSISRSFYIHPPWEPPSPEYPINLLVNPSHAFGTGTHESTRLALCFLYEHTTDAESVLDFGTGSGILAIAAWKINPEAEVFAFDIDYMSVESAMESFILNEVSSIHCWAGTAASVNSSFDLVVANLTAEVIRSGHTDLSRLAKRSLILSGITDKQVDFVLETFRDSNLKLQEIKEENHWIAMHLAR